MLSSRLIIAMCDTYDDSIKFVHFNENNSIISCMELHHEGYKHVCGQPISGEKYLVIDCELTGLVPDILFEHVFRSHGRTKTARYYAYLMEDYVPQGAKLLNK